MIIINFAADVVKWLSVIGRIFREPASYAGALSDCFIKG